MKQTPKKLITHNGSFHTDDIFACATLTLLLEKREESFEIIRTRDPEIIKAGDYVFDVGGVYDEVMNRFDHHQKGFEEYHKEGILYSSFGLVWKKFGEYLTGSKKVAELIDNKLVVPVDAWDNGFDLAPNQGIISPYFIQHAFFSMLPTWREEDLSKDDMFLKSVEIARMFLSREITQAEDTILAEEKVTEIYKNTKDKRIIILDKQYPAEYILCDFPEPLFMIYPRSSDDTWGVKAVRENPKTFKNRKDFPKSWGGLRDEDLANITGVTDAIFCHKGLFLAVAKSQEGAIKLAELALNLN